MVKSKPAKTQKSFDSKTTMFEHKHEAIKFIRQHVLQNNPIEPRENSRNGTTIYKIPRLCWGSTALSKHDFISE